jgi:hypothetical protein
MTSRSRALTYGSAALLVLAGILCAVFVGGTTGQLLTFVLIAFGLGGVVLLVFYEVGLGEDRERAREEQHERARREDQRRRDARAASVARDQRLRRARFRRRP